jgi:hypothetical protein
MTIKSLSHTNGLTKKGDNNSYQGKPITEIITNGFFSVNRRWTVKYWNKAAERLLGVEAKDIVEKNLWEKFAGSFRWIFIRSTTKRFCRMSLFTLKNIGGKWAPGLT